MNIEAYLYTNYRSTYDYCLSSLKEQNVLERIIIYPNQLLVYALNRSLTLCQTTHFVKVDDDFILHPRALQYMWRRFLSLPKNHKIGIYCAHLWEDWTNKPISGIKIYSVEALRNIGGFISDEYGKVDKLVNIRLQNAGYNIIRDASIVGIHSCGTWEEQLKYEEIWDNQAEESHQKSTREQMKEYSKSVFQQDALRLDFLVYQNQLRNTRFYRWIEKQKAKGEYYE